MSVYILCGDHKVLYKIPPKTDTELPYSLEYGLSGQIVDQKCSILFLCFFLAVATRHDTTGGSRETLSLPARRSNVRAARPGRAGRGL